MRTVASRGFDNSVYEIWARPHPLILHWVINPVERVSDRGTIESRPAGG